MTEWPILVSTLHWRCGVFRVEIPHADTGKNPPYLSHRQALLAFILPTFGFAFFTCLPP
jgi:hypothetical protein